jgi:hypothetical protein
LVHNEKRSEESIVTPEDTANLRDWYEDGATIEALVAQTPFSYRAIRTALLDAGVTLRPPMIQVPPCPPGMAEMYKNGATIRQVGAKYDRSYSQARIMLLHAGVTLRSSGESRSMRWRDLR